MRLFPGSPTSAARTAAPSLLPLFQLDDFVWVMRASDGRRGLNATAALAEADANVSLARTLAADDHLVAVLEKAAGLVADVERLRAPPGDLEQAAERVARRTGDRAAGEEVSRPKVAAVARVVRDHLRGRPVHVGEPCPAHPLRPRSLLAHRARAKTDVEDDVDPAAGAIVLVAQVCQRRRIIHGPRRCRNAVGGECVHRDDPRRHGRREALREERAEGLILPAL